MNRYQTNKSHFIGLLCLCIWCSFTPSFNQNCDPIKPVLIETTDHVIVVKNNTVIFDYLEQADIEDPVQIRVIDTPKFGEVMLNDDKSFGYTPTPDLCGAVDQFTYLMTTKDQSIMVAVSIDILCETLTVFNGVVDTNKDTDELETFQILGIEKYPNNILYIFDSEGIEIFQYPGYNNNWNGKVDSSEHMIPENLYYYVLNDGSGNFLSGYLTRQ